MARRRRARSFGIFAPLLVALPHTAYADGSNVSFSIAAHQETAFRYSDGEISLARFTALPKAVVDLGGGWRLDAAFRFEAGPDETGLGELDGYSRISRPLLATPDARIEIDRATLRWRGAGTTFTLGKQSVAWGALDGVQITDRASPTRLRDFIFFDNRPDRLSRWGARLQTNIAGFDVDLFAQTDPTVSQLARPRDAFGLKAPRFTLGAPTPTSTLPPITPRDRYIADGTYGARVQKRLGRVEAALMYLSGPDPEPIFIAAPTEIGGLAFDHPRRQMIGATIAVASGQFVWRLEGASFPDQTFNLADPSTPAGFSADRRQRLLAGAGFDWRAPHGLFVNTQIAVDHVPDADGLFRPASDVVMTGRVQKALGHDKFRLQTEIILSALDGDGVARPSIEWRQTDNLSFSVGSDIIFGSANGLIGQFSDQSRFWSRLSYAL